MKQLAHIILIGLSLLCVVGCGGTTQITPSKNSALNSVSRSDAGKKQKYFMQEQIDDFVAKEWIPTLAKNKEIRKKYLTKHVDAKTGEESFAEKQSTTFTLQEGLEKLRAFQKANPQDYSSSNVKKLESMPVIGE